MNEEIGQFISQIAGNIFYAEQQINLDDKTASYWIGFRDALIATETLGLTIFDGRIKKEDA